MISVPDRRNIVKLIRGARQAGARLDPACRVVGLTARTFERWTQDDALRKDGRPEAQRRAPANKLSPEEKKRVLDVCHQSEYASLPPGQIIPQLADTGTYIASESTFYRILHEENEQHHRGRSRKPRKSTPPEGYCSTGPNQVWTWDITWLPTSIRGLYFYLYMIVDVFSRKIVGWEIHDAENSENAARLVHKAVLAEGCVLKPLVLHSDNGSPQKGSTLRAKLDALGITPSFSRPRVSNDNPYSEALFRTCKYRPDYPRDGFETIDVARQWVKGFAYWYNFVHLHSAIRFVSPAQRHRRKDEAILANRRNVYQNAKRQRPGRWSGETRNWEHIPTVWLNPPKGAQVYSVVVNEAMPHR